MKIEGTGTSRTTPAKRPERAGQTKGGSFTRHLDDDSSIAPAIAGTGMSAPVHGVDALLSLQEVGDSTSEQGRARARRWGEDLLDRLDLLRLGILSGGIPRADLIRIASMVGAQRERTTDPRLAEVLAEIELRARVELAKYAPRG
ncbi:MAG: flagellar assembly protein FliX [Alphaproteobacteria bacterium]